MNKCENCNGDTLSAHCRQHLPGEHLQAEYALTTVEDDIIELLQFEYDTLVELKQPVEYTQGFEHALLLIKMRYRSNELENNLENGNK